jgi:hypothetical protein
MRTFKRPGAVLQILRADENAKDGEAGQWLEYLSNLGV